MSLAPTGRRGHWRGQNDEVSYTTEYLLRLGGLLTSYCRWKSREPCGFRDSLPFSRAVCVAYVIAVVISSRVTALLVIATLRALYNAAAAAAAAAR